jgi:hypothetical protein
MVSIPIEAIGEGRGFDCWNDQEIFCYSITSRPGLGPTHPRTEWVAEALFLWGGKGYLGYHSPQSISKVSNGGTTSPLPVCLHAIVLNYLRTRTTSQLPFTYVYILHDLEKWLWQKYNYDGTNFFQSFHRSRITICT